MNTPENKKWLRQEKLIPCFNEEDYEAIISEYGTEETVCDFEENTYYGVVQVVTYRRLWGDSLDG